MDKNFSTKKAIVESVEQLNRIPIVNDKTFEKFMKYRTDEEKEKFLWGLINTSIKAFLWGMAHGYSITIPGIVQFKHLNYSNYVRDLRRQITTKSSKEVSKMVSERLKTNPKYHKSLLFPKVEQR